jgi:hypothetical protein
MTDAERLAKALVDAWPRADYGAWDEQTQTIRDLWIHAAQAVIDDPCWTVTHTPADPAEQIAMLWCNERSRRNATAVGWLGGGGDLDKAATETVRTLIDSGIILPGPTLDGA